MFHSVCVCVCVCVCDMYEYVTVYPPPTKVCFCHHNVHDTTRGSSSPPLHTKCYTVCVRVRVICISMLQSIHKRLLQRCAPVIIVCMTRLAAARSSPPFCIRLFPLEIYKNKNGVLFRASLPKWDLIVCVAKLVSFFLVTKYCDDDADEYAAGAHPHTRFAPFFLPRPKKKNPKWGSPYVQPGQHRSLKKR